MNESLWAPQIYTKNGFVKSDILEGKKALDVGCGDRKLPGTVGIDRLALPAVDIVHDLNVFPWPVESATYDLVFANHYLEHVDDVLLTLAEVHRVLKSGGRLVVQVPYFRSVDAFGDPTHSHFFTSATLDYVCSGTTLARYEYTPFTFTKKGFWYAWPHVSSNPIVQIFKKFIHRHTEFYDQYLSLLLPVECLTWELEK